MMAKVVKFFGQVKQEALKVSWPSKAEVVNSTLIVMGVVVIFSLFCLGVDYFIHEIVQFLLKLGS